MTTVLPVRIRLPAKTTLPRPQAGTGVPAGAADVQPLWMDRPSSRRRSRIPAGPRSRRSGALPARGSMNGPVSIERVRRGVLRGPRRDALASAFFRGSGVVASVGELLGQGDPLGEERARCHGEGLQRGASCGPRADACSVKRILLRRAARPGCPSRDAHSSRAPLGDARNPGLGDRGSGSRQSELHGDGGQRLGRPDVERAEAARASAAEPMFVIQGAAAAARGEDGEHPLNGRAGRRLQPCRPRPASAMQMRRRGS